ncbi:hypothetical protein CK203_059335 [Vitis vinifera]|uniref:Uncharacterized protein n=1 Tax=Vitis vinifera TaxID=29760 RepID=A0A438H2N9_VITVI|nr:hypothetical protein CK203_059335 [Vitis vinifera]
MPSYQESGYHKENRPFAPPSEPKPRAPSAAFRQSAMARTQGVKSSSLSDRKRAPKETPVQSSMSEPPRPLVVPPPVEDTPLSPPARSYQTRSSSHPPKKKATVSEPELIDLLEPSSEPPSKPQPSQPPPTQSQIPSCMTPECLSGVHAKAQGLLPSTAEVPYGAFADSQGFFLSPCSNGLLLVHDHTPGPRSYCYPLHHRRTSCILGARHIAEALRIPYEPARPEDYRVWTHPAQSDIVHIMSRGASTRQYLLRKELPPSMFFIDALLRHNIFSLQHWYRGEEFY